MQRLVHGEVTLLAPPSSRAGRILAVSRDRVEVVPDLDVAANRPSFHLPAGGFALAVHETAMKPLQIFVAVQSLLVAALGVLVVAHAVRTPALVRGINRGVEQASRPRPKPAAEAKKAVELTPADVFRALIAGNDRFVADRETPRRFVEERKALVAHQHPKAIVLACSDSRVPPELLFDQSLGDLFVVRSAGNVADTIGLASMEYAAEHLGSKVLIVLGHERCGAITAAASGEKMPTANLQALVDELSPSLKDLKGVWEGKELIHRGVEANVDATADEVLERSALLRERVEKGELVVIQAVYDLDSGHVRQLAGPTHALEHLQASRAAVAAAAQQARP
jgi:carbonic anhydrase